MGNGTTWLRRRLHRLTADEQVLEAENLQQAVQEIGAVPVSRCQDRESVRVAGTVRSVTLKSLAGAPSLVAEIYDGSGSVNAVFLGRRRIPGIEAGRRVLVEGRLTHQVESGATIYNPRYELLADSPGPS